MTVALNGDGGDESFAGYLRYPANALTAWVDHVPAAIRTPVAELSRRLLDSRERRSAQVYARRYLTTLAEPAARRYAAHVGIFDASEREAVLDPSLRAEIDPARTTGVIDDPWESATGSSALDVLLQTDVETYLPGDLLTKIDIATMAHSLEARSPLLDPEVMEFAAALPDRHKVRLGQKKWILRRAYRDRLPEGILDGPKRGFGVPIGTWFREELRDWVRDVLLDRDAVSRDLLRPDAVRELIDVHQSGRSDRSQHIWALLCLEQWQREIRAAG